MSGVRVIVLEMETVGNTLKMAVGDAIAKFERDRSRILS